MVVLESTRGILGKLPVLLRVGHLRPDDASEDECQQARSVSAEEIGAIIPAAPEVPLPMADEPQLEKEWFEAQLQTPLRQVARVMSLIRQLMPELTEASRAKANEAIRLPRRAIEWRNRGLRVPTSALQSEPAERSTP